MPHLFPSCHARWLRYTYLGGNTYVYARYLSLTVRYVCASNGYSGQVVFNSGTAKCNAAGERLFSTTPPGKAVAVKEIVPSRERQSSRPVWPC